VPIMLTCAIADAVQVESDAAGFRRPGSIGRKPERTAERLNPNSDSLRYGLRFSESAQSDGRWADPGYRALSAEAVSESRSVLQNLRA
jgi:hypothetical protein